MGMVVCGRHLAIGFPTTRYPPIWDDGAECGELSRHLNRNCGGV